MRHVMKKRMALLLALVLCVGLLAGCGGKDGGQNGNGGAGSQSQSGGGEASGQEVFVFTSNGVDIKMNAEADPIVEALGDPISTFDAPSCAFQGTDWIYTYDGFQINTYPLNDVNYVSSVVLTSDAVATPEGLEIGGTKDDMIAAYGEDFAEEYDLCTYTRGDSKLAVLFEDGYITSIEYQAVLPQK